MRSNAKPASKVRYGRLGLEGLEDRTVPTIIYNPVFGAETQKDSDNDEFGIRPQVYLEFWGQYWTGGVGATQIPLVQAAAAKVIDSTYLTLVNQYGADATGMSLATGTDIYNDNNSNPSNFDGGDVDAAVQTLIDAGTFPEPDANGNDHSSIYVVVTPPNVYSSGGTGVGGFNQVKTHIDISLSGVETDTGECWVGSGDNQDDPATPGVDESQLVNTDTFSYAFGHEVAELMSDWDNEGFEVNQPVGAPPGEGNQIGDYEGNAYRFRLSDGAEVQPLWSRQDSFSGTSGAWAVYDGTQQQFFLDASEYWIGTDFQGHYVLTIEGDQTNVPNDDITIGTGTNGGVQVTENGETLKFDPGQITDIIIHAKTGNNTITLNPLPTGVGLDMDSVGGTINLAAPNTTNTWYITGDGSGSLKENGVLSEVPFENVTSLTGGTNSDTFMFLPHGRIDGNIEGVGPSTLDYSEAGPLAAGPVAVDLQARTATDIGGTFSGINNIVGSAGIDTLTGREGDTTWSVTGPDAGTVNFVKFSSFENLQGNTWDDTFMFLPGGSISGTIDGGAADSGNSLDFSKLSDPVTVNLQTQTASHVGGTVTGFNQFTGGTGSDTLVGPDGGADWILNNVNDGAVVTVPTLATVSFVSFENLMGGAGADLFQFLPGGGAIAGNLDGGGGDNTLDYAAKAGPVTVNFTSGTTSFVTGTFANINNVIGSASGDDTIIGPDATWIVSGANSGTVNAITFTSFENLIGSPGTDSFTFLPGGSISGNLDGGGGNDTLNYSALTGPITVNLQTRKAPLIGGTFANITALIGSAGNDVLVGPDGGATWTLTGPNAGSVAGVAFSSFENLVGGSGDDAFVFAPGGGVSGNIDGGGGNNRLDYHLLSTPVTLGLGTNTATGIGGTFTNVNGFVGGSGVNTVAGPASGGTWTITGVNTVEILGFTLSGFQTITAGAGPDTFAFLTGARLDGKIDGGGGVNNLTYAGYTGSVIVDLLIHSATGVGGGIYNVQNVTGSNGDSMLVGDAGANVLTGGTGRNVLIGDGGSDTVIGGGHDNILIGDSTVWDANLTALQAIFAEWTRTDLGFEQRVAHLISPAPNGLNGSYTLDKKTVNSDGAVDTLIGGDPAGLNWFFVTHKQDVYSPHNPGDHITQI